MLDVAAQSATAAASATAAPVRNAMRGPNRFQRRPKTIEAGRAVTPTAA